jgi:hypothetical protein
VHATKVKQSCKHGTKRYSSSTVGELWGRTRKGARLVVGTLTWKSLEDIQEVEVQLHHDVALELDLSSTTRNSSAIIAWVIASEEL